MQASAYLQKGLTPEENLKRLATYRLPYTLEWMNLPNQQTPYANSTVIKAAKTVCVFAIGFFCYYLTHKLVLSLGVAAVSIPVVLIFLDLKIASLYQRVKGQQELGNITTLYQAMAGYIDERSRQKEDVLIENFNVLSSTGQITSQQMAEEKLRNLASDYDRRLECADFIKWINEVGETLEKETQLGSIHFSARNACERYLYGSDLKSKATVFEIFMDKDAWRIAKIKNC